MNPGGKSDAAGRAFRLGASVARAVGANLFAIRFARPGRVANEFAPGKKGTAGMEVGSSPARRSWIAGAALGLALLLTGCGNMKQQNYLRPEEPSIHLPGGTSAQLPPAHTVPHGPEPRDSAFLTGERNGKLVAEIPLPVTRELLERGRDRFTIYCAMCHGPDGYGHGIVVRRGFSAPPSYHDPRLRNAPVGHFFRVMTSGYGIMYPYADRLTPADRWAVAAYIRALQLSQHVKLGDLPDDDRRRISSADPAPGAQGAYPRTAAVRAAGGASATPRLSP